MNSATPNARSRRTRESLLVAGRQLLEEGGFDALTMAATAERAEVSRRGIYLHFSSRAELVTAIHDHIAEQFGRAESLSRVWKQTDPVAALDEWAAHLARYHVRVLAVDRAVRAARFGDPDVARYRTQVVENQRRACRRLLQGLADHGLLSDTWTVDSGTDMLWSLLSTDMIEALLLECDWSRESLRDRLRDIYRSIFVNRDSPDDFHHIG